MRTIAAYPGGHADIDAGVPPNLIAASPATARTDQRYPPHYRGAHGRQAAAALELRMAHEPEKVWKLDFDVFGRATENMQQNHVRSGLAKTSEGLKMQVGSDFSDGAPGSTRTNTSVRKDLILTSGRVYQFRHGGTLFRAARINLMGGTGQRSRLRVRIGLSDRRKACPALAGHPIACGEGPNSARSVSHWEGARVVPAQVTSSRIYGPDVVCWPPLIARAIIVFSRASPIDEKKHLSPCRSSDRRTLRFASCNY